MIFGSYKVAAVRVREEDHQQEIRFEKRISPDLVGMIAGRQVLATLTLSMPQGMTWNVGQEVRVEGFGQCEIVS